MKKRKNNIWLTIGVIVICVLLLYWLFARTLIVEDEELGTTDVPRIFQFTHRDKRKDSANNKHCNQKFDQCPIIQCIFSKIHSNQN